MQAKHTRTRIHTPLEHRSCRQVKQNISGRHAQDESVNIQRAGIGKTTVTKESQLMMELEWRLRIDYLRVVSITLGWNQDQSGLGTGM